VIVGESGIGKSETVLALLERGYSLVADDVVKLRLHDGAEVIGTAKEMAQHLMEVRGIGIIRHVWNSIRDHKGSI
jgi:HPr kinase/phosphorylase